MMKVITFFNEKGGSGKTTLMALCADYFAYKLGQNVVVVDFDAPSYHFWNMRQNDLDILNKNPMSALARECAKNPNYYNVLKVEERDHYSRDDLMKLASQLREQAERHDGYMFLDFPGRFRPSDPACFLMLRGLIDLMVIPIDSDRQTRSSALNIYNIISQLTNAYDVRDRVVCLWNREAQKERSGRKDWYSDAEKSFGMLGIPVAGKRVRDILIARRDADTFGFIRNTLCWPQGNIDRACGYIGQIFDEIYLRVNGQWTEESKTRIYGNQD